MQAEAEKQQGLGGHAKAKGAAKLAAAARAGGRSGRCSQIGDLPETSVESQHGKFHMLVPSNPILHPLVILLSFICS